MARMARGRECGRALVGPRLFPDGSFVTWKMRRFSLLPGCGNSILRSRRPGRSSAGSRVSARLVHMITLTLTD